MSDPWPDEWEPANQHERTTDSSFSIFTRLAHWIRRIKAKLFNRNSSTGLVTIVLGGVIVLFAVLYQLLVILVTFYGSSEAQQSVMQGIGSLRGTINSIGIGETHVLALVIVGVGIALLVGWSLLPRY